jgi:hypothetical protein
MLTLLLIVLGTGGAVFLAEAWVGYLIGGCLKRLP